MISRFNFFYGLCVLGWLLDYRIWYHPVVFGREGGVIIAVIALCYALSAGFKDLIHVKKFLLMATAAITANIINIIIDLAIYDPASHHLALFELVMSFFWACAGMVVAYLVYFGLFLLVNKRHK